jgi:hypothetical protein
MMWPADILSVEMGDNEIFGLEGVPHNIEISEFMDLFKPGNWLSATILQAWCK